MKKILSIILSITMLFSMTAVAFAEETTTSGAREVEGIIKVGTCADFAPFEYMENDKMLGFDIELMNHIASRINYGVEFVNMPFDKLIPAVISGEVDCAISAISQTNERRQVVDFSRPYLRATITENNGETSTKNQEVYSIVFKEGMSDTKLKSSFPTEEEKIYLLITGALDELISDGTVDKLIEKYNLNKEPAEDTEYHYEYDTVKGSATPAAKTKDEENQTSAATVPAPSEWAAKDIDYALAVGITDNGKDYLYKENITREEFCELIYNLIVLTSDEITAPITDSFTDTKNDKILMLNGLGIINGKSATEFAPDDYLTREEAAAIIVRMINKVMPMPATEMWFEYDDIEEISEWASDSVQTISNLGFMRGVGDNNFAPKDTYTTEQAIVTLVRVLEGAGASGMLDEKTSLGIIGGADGPTAIIVGDNVNVIEQEEYDSLYIEAKKNKAKIDEFYIDEAIKLIKESAELAKDREFISMYTTNDDMTNKLLSLGTVDFTKPDNIFLLSADNERIIENIKALAGEDAENIDFEKMTKLNKKYNFSALASFINASYGAENLAALTILTNSRGYIMPKDFENDFALYLEYEGEYSAIVSFSKYGDGVISGNMSFVRNGDKDNVFRRLYEIISTVGDGGVDIALVERGM